MLSCSCFCTWTLECHFSLTSKTPPTVYSDDPDVLEIKIISICSGYAILHYLDGACQLLLRKFLSEGSFFLHFVKFLAILFKCCIFFAVASLMHTSSWIP